METDLEKLSGLLDSCQRRIAYLQEHAVRTEKAQIRLLEILRQALADETPLAELAKQAEQAKQELTGWKPSDGLAARREM